MQNEQFTHKAKIVFKNGIPVSVCQSCGMESPPEHNFCTGCGARLMPASELMGKLSSMGLQVPGQGESR